MFGKSSFPTRWQGHFLWKTLFPWNNKRGRLVLHFIFINYFNYFIFLWKYLFLWNRKWEKFLEKLVFHFIFNNNIYNFNCFCFEISISIQFQHFSLFNFTFLTDPIFISKVWQLICKSALVQKFNFVFIWFPAKNFSFFWS